MAISPMMQQYLDIHAQYPDCILFFRLGDFYEMFFDDALLVAKELELTLTGKQCGLPERAPMCGVPFHACDAYLGKLIERGYKVAICEQTQDPALCKGLVPREVVQVVTPGTVTSAAMLNEKENNYIACAFAGEDYISLCYADISTGELALTSFVNGIRGEQTLVNELVRISAKELILPESMADSEYMDEAEHLIHPFINRRSDAFFSYGPLCELLKEHFSVHSVSGLGLGDDREKVLALGGLLAYLGETQKSISHLSHVNIYDVSGHMALDKATIRNLELTETLYDNKLQGSLLWVLDKCHTAMGSRRLKQWLREPLNRTYEINERLDAVQALLDETLLRNNLKESLKAIYDLERLAGRVASGNANGKDLVALKNSLAALPEIRNDLVDYTGLLGTLRDSVNPLSEVFETIESAICDEPPMSIKEGHLIKPGYSEELDNLKNGIKDAREWIANLEPLEKERTGITHLKVGFNKVFGYYIEVSKSNLDLVPDDYIRKQTLVGAERFITPALKEMESLVLNAETKINQLEYDIFCDIRNFTAGFIKELQETAFAVSAIDALCSFAEVSAKLGYVRPFVDDSDELFIKGGRHPVIEQTIENGLFVSNDTYCNLDDASMLLITGPNMAGKSTYMRQTALIVLMAQVGCFVPCESAHIGVCDRIFTRIGASDNLAMGQSTFFVEMSELAYILNSLSNRSLIILDEIGRGTSTYDGLSIAWAVVNYLCDDVHKARTMFATHYHELTALEGVVRGVKNLNVDVSEDGGEIVFLHKIAIGSASRSYGIHVAKLAGVPSKVLKDAESVLSTLEESAEFSEQQVVSTTKSKTKPEEEMQLSFFGSASSPALEELKSLNLMDLRPSEALRVLEDLQALALKQK